MTGKELLKIAVKEIQRLGYEDCMSCVHSGNCIYADECDYRWKHADEAERLIEDEKP